MTCLTLSSTAFSTAGTFGSPHLMYMLSPAQTWRIYPIHSWKGRKGGVELGDSADPVPPPEMACLIPLIKTMHPTFSTRSRVPAWPQLHLAWFLDPCSSVSALVTGFLQIRDSVLLFQPCIAWELQASPDASPPSWPLNIITTPAFPIVNEAHCLHPLLFPLTAPEHPRRKARKKSEDSAFLKEILKRIICFP